MFIALFVIISLLVLFLKPLAFDIALQMAANVLMIFCLLVWNGTIPMHQERYDFFRSCSESIIGQVILYSQLLNSIQFLF